MGDDDDYMPGGIFRMPDGGFHFGGADRDEVAFELDQDSPAVVETIDVGGAEVYVLSIPLEPDFPHDLSASEREVVKLALRGASNAEIAEERGSAVQTVANQLRSAFKKIGVNSRAELAAALFGSPPSD